MPDTPLPPVAAAPRGSLAVIKKKLPPTPTLAALHKLSQPPDGPRPLVAAYVVPTVLIGLLDCITEATEQPEAAAHLDALGVRPVWRASSATKNADGAARTLLARLRSNTDPVCLVFLFGKLPPPPKPPVALATAEEPAAEGGIPPGAPTNQEQDAGRVLGDNERDGVAQGGGEGGDGEASEHAAGTSAGAASARSRRPRPSASLVPSDDGFIPLSRPLVLRARPGSVASGGGGGGGPPSSSGGSDTSRPRSAATTCMTRTFGGGDDDYEAPMYEEYYNPSAARAAAAATARLNIIGNGAAPALRSTHDLPNAGNWVRLSKAQQHDVRRRAETARRRAAEGLTRDQLDQPGRDATTTSTFGNEPRQSASRRWAHQGAQTYTGRLPGGISLPGAGSAKPGSFLPLKVGASALQPRPASGGRQVLRVLHPSVEEEGS